PMTGSACPPFPRHHLCDVVGTAQRAPLPTLHPHHFFPFLATTRSYAACSRSPTLGPAFFRRFTPRCVSRNSSMNSAHIFGPPSLKSLARMPSSSETARYLNPQPDICARIGNSSITCSVTERLPFCLWLGSSSRLI